MLYMFNATPTLAYLLFYLVILDLGTTLYVFNDLARFYNLRKALRDYFIVIGNL